MLTEVKKKIISRLQRLLEMGLDDVVYKTGYGGLDTKRQQGICGNLEDLGRYKDTFGHSLFDKDQQVIDKILRGIFKRWPKFSGHGGYPIPGAATAFSECCDHNTFWVGEQGELRIELCNFIIDELNKEIQHAE